MAGSGMDCSGGFSPAGGVSTAGAFSSRRRLRGSLLGPLQPAEIVHDIGKVTVFGPGKNPVAGIDPTERLGLIVVRKFPGRMRVVVGARDARKLHPVEFLQRGIIVFFQDIGDKHAVLQQLDRVGALFFPEQVPEDFSRSRVVLFLKRYFREIELRGEESVDLSSAPLHRIFALPHTASARSRWRRACSAPWAYPE